MSRTCRAGEHRACVASHKPLDLSGWGDIVGLLCPPRLSAEEGSGALRMSLPPQEPPLPQDRPDVGLRGGQP